MSVHSLLFDEHEALYSSSSEDAGFNDFAISYSKNQRDFGDNQRYFYLGILGNRFEDIELGEILGDLEIQGLENHTFGGNLNWGK
ncbi:hypothetical protein CXB51_025426 [Gossypium anomalum]|uniref:Uncharacterized protein n=1 Tax=Gossypium anomalum TaxID=47600 RepID=A0A8J5YJU9_9ROSI|nr:hypothetical protein CXB51_025426 [Gossypium anomalum]